MEHRIINKILRDKDMTKYLLGLVIASFAFLMSCSSSTEDTRIDCSQSDLSVSVTGSVAPSCNIQGSIEVAGSGGNSPYRFSIDGMNFQSSTVFSDLAAGSYTITISDANDCTAQIDANLEAGEGAITLELIASNSECGNSTGSVTVMASGGDGNFTYSIDGGDEQSQNSFENIANGSHSVSVSDGEGCSATKSVTVFSNVSWMENIMPIFDVNCTISGCHNGDNENIPNFSVFATVQSFAGAIKINTGDGTMPRAGSGLTLTQDQIDLIACWVDDGAPNN